MNPIVEDLPQDKQPAPSPQSVARQEPISHMALAARFNLDAPTPQEEKQLAEIWALAQGLAKSEDIQDIVWEVIHLEGVLGAPRLGERRIDRLYTYAKLKRQEAEIQTRLKDVSGSHNIRQW